MKMKLLVMQVIKAILGEEIDFRKVEKITVDAKYEQGDAKASVAGIRFIISSAAKHDVDEETLSSELQQLGLPKEHAAALCKTYEGKLSTLREEFKKQSMRRSARLEEISCEVDQNNSEQDGNQETYVKINMKLGAGNGTAERKTLRITPDKLRILLHELKSAQGMMTKAS